MTYRKQRTFSCGGGCRGGRRRRRRRAGHMVCRQRLRHRLQRRPHRRRHLRKSTSSNTYQTASPLSPLASSAPAVRSPTLTGPDPHQDADTAPQTDQQRPSNRIFHQKNTSRDSTTMAETGYANYKHFHDMLTIVEMENGNRF